MKKLLILITLFFSLLFGLFIINNNHTFADDDLKTMLDKDIVDLVDDYTPNKVVKTTDATVETGLKELIQKLVTNMSYILGIAAIGAIVYGGIMIIISAGEDEKISKGKNIIKWAVLGFLGLVTASGLIIMVINIMYGIAG